MVQSGLKGHQKAVILLKISLKWTLLRSTWNQAAVGSMKSLFDNFLENPRKGNIKKIYLTLQHISMPDIQTSTTMQ